MDAKLRAVKNCVRSAQIYSHSKKLNLNKKLLKSVFSNASEGNAIFGQVGLFINIDAFAMTKYINAFSMSKLKFKLNEGRSDMKPNKSVIKTDRDKVMHQLKKGDKGHLRKKLLICFLMKARRPRNLP